MSKALVRKIALIGSALACLLSNANAATSPPDDSWQFSVSPYLWLPTLNGELNFQMPPGTGGRPDVEVGPNDYLSALNLLLMLSGEARKGRWGVLGDVISLDASSNRNRVKSISGPLGSSFPIDLGSSVDLHGVLVQFGGFYELTQTPSVTLDAVAAVRSFNLRSSLSWNLSGPADRFPASGSYAETVHLVTPVVGIRGRVGLGQSKWFLPYYLDVGAGSASFTSQFDVGVGYSTDLGEAKLTFRQLSYDQKHDKLLQGFSFGGPAVSATFRF